MNTTDEPHNGRNGHGGETAQAAGPRSEPRPPFHVATGRGPGGAHPGAPAETLYQDPREVISRAVEIIRSRWALGVLSALLAGAAVWGLLFRFRPIEFTAQTTLLAQSPLDQILKPDAATPADFDRREDALTNHLSVMLSRSFRQRVAASFTPAESLEIERPYLGQGEQPSPAALLSVLSRKITVDREREREFFTITVKHASADAALLIANRFASTYIDLVQAELHRANEAAAQLLSKQAAQVTAQIMETEDRRRDYRRQHNLISAEENQAILEDRIKQVNLARSDLRVQRARLDAEVGQARGDLARTPLPFTNSVLSAYAGIQPLRQQLDALEVQRDVLAIRYGPNHAKMADVNGGIAATRDALARNYQRAFADLESQLELTRTAENGLNREFDEAFNESLELSRSAVQLGALAQEADGRRRTLDDLIQRIGKSSIDSSLPADLLRVIDPGYIHKPLVPLEALYAAIVGLFALGAFVVVPLGANFFDEKVNEHVDIEGKLHLDVIGAIPRLSRTRSEERPHIVRDNVNLGYAEAFLALASQIDLASAKGAPRRILVTSTLPDEGKSTLASNLASAYTRLGRRTALVDCDFRKPSQRAIHRVGGDSGLLHWARAGFQENTGLLDVGGAVDASVLPDGTFLIPAGARDLQPARYLSAEGMARFFALLRAEFEVVIVDTPPAGVFPDALILARHCDETLLVARDGKASTHQLRRLVRDFGKSGAPPIGVVLNAFSQNASHPRLGYGRLYGRYGYPEARTAAGATG